MMMDAEEGRRGIADEVVVAGEDADRWQRRSIVSTGAIVAL